METAYGDYTIKMYLNREGFQVIHDTITYKKQQMMEVVEGRKLHC